LTLQKEVRLCASQVKYSLGTTYLFQDRMVHQEVPLVNGKTDFEYIGISVENKKKTYSRSKLFKTLYCQIIAPHNRPAKIIIFMA